jgi:hypothetical protein
MNLSIAVTSPSNGEAKLGRPLICESVFFGAVDKSYTPKQNIFWERDQERNFSRVETRGSEGPNKLWESVFTR